MLTSLFSNTVKPWQSTVHLCLVQILPTQIKSHLLLIDLTRPLPTITPGLLYVFFSEHDNQRLKNCGHPILPSHFMWWLQLLNSTEPSGGQTVQKWSLSNGEVVRPQNAESPSPFRKIAPVENLPRVQCSEKSKLSLNLQQFKTSIPDEPRSWGRPNTQAPEIRAGC